MKPIPSSTNHPEPLALERVKSFDADLRDRLVAYRETSGLQNIQLARELDTHPSTLSRYLNGRPEGDVARIEAAAADVLKTAATRANTKIELFPTSVSEEIAKRITTIRKTNDFGLLHGPAGCGKTSAVQLYAAANPTTILIELATWNRNGAGLERLLFNASENKAWKHGRRMDWLEARMRGSNRLIIVDNAQRLTTRAVGWLFDFHDTTGCPILLTGNPEVLIPIEKNDQNFSRIGMVKEVGLRDDISECADRMIAKLAPSCTEDIHDLAVHVAQERGHLRALRKQILLANEIHQMPKYRGTYRDAFTAAHTQLIRDYAL